MIAVIADDLTGAAEIAGLGWRHGLRAEILHRDEPPSRANLVVYDSDSRNCSDGEAARRVARIARRIRGQKPDWVYKKVDSVLRGNVLAEAQAMQKALSLARCLLVPANPSARRIIKDGKYFIRGKPLHQTDFRNDPGHPRRSAKVMELLGPSGKGQAVVRKPGASGLPDGVVVGEAATAGDVRHWSQRVDLRTLAAGGADFFTALLQYHGFRAKLSMGGSVSCAAPKTLFVSGSLAESSLHFLNDCRTRGWPVLLMPEELFAGAKSERLRRSPWTREIICALQQHARVAVGIGQPKHAGRRKGRQLGLTLTATIRQVLEKYPPDRVCVDGGSTAALLLQQMGWKRLVVEREFATGVTGVRSPSQRGLVLVLKPGSYAWPDCLCD